MWQMPHVGECGHGFCYVCVQTAVTEDPDFRCAAGRAVMCGDAHAGALADALCALADSQQFGGGSKVG